MLSRRTTKCGLLATLLIAAFFVAKKALAVAPIWIALGISTSLHALVFGIYDYFVKPVKMDDGKTINAVLKLTPVSDAEIVAQQSQVNIPTTTNAIAQPPYSYTIPRAADGRPSGGIITANSVEELLQKINYLPSDVANYGTNVPWTWAPSYNGKIDVLGGSIVRNGAVQLYIRWYIDGQYHYSYFDAGGEPTCPSGYSFNSTTLKCDLTNIDEVRNDAYRNDRVCIINGGAPNPFDPDCQALFQQNKMNVTNGYAVIADPNGDRTVIASSRASDGGTNVSQTSPLPNGGYRRDDVHVSPDGQVGAANSISYPSSPPPAYPGDTGIGEGGGTTIPGGTPGFGTVQGGTCGGPNQPACNIRIVDGEGNVVDFGGGVGDPTEGIPGTMPGEISGGLKGLADEAVLPTSPVCPADAFSFTLPFPEPIGDFTLDDRGIFCSVMSDYGELIRMLSIAAAFIAAMFIVLRA